MNVRDEIFDKLENLQVGQGFDIMYLSEDKSVELAIGVRCLKIADTEFFFFGGYSSEGKLYDVDYWYDQEIEKDLDCMIDWESARIEEKIEIF